MKKNMYTRKRKRARHYFTRPELEDLKRRTDLVALYEKITGNPMEPAGKNRFRGICPFHKDSCPSFVIFDRRRYHCFGCHEHGDAFDLLTLIGIHDLVEAAVYLGGDPKKIPRGELSAMIARQRRRKQLLEDFREWERKTADELGLLIRAGHKAMGSIKDEETLHKYGGIYDSLAIWEYWFHDIIINGSDEDKYELYLSLKDRPFGLIYPFSGGDTNE